MEKAQNTATPPTDAHDGGGNEKTPVDDIVSPQFDTDERGVKDANDALGENDKPSKAHEFFLRQPVLSFCCSRFPRTCAILIGVILPLFCLIFLSMGFGSKLADYEAPGEIVINNQKLEAMYFANTSAAIVTNITSILPRLCFALFLKSQTSEVSTETAVSNAIQGYLDKNLSLSIDDDLLESTDFDNPNYMDAVRLTYGNSSTNVRIGDLFAFMSECGAVAQEMSNELLGLAIGRLVEDSQDLTFNWIRCFEGARGGKNFRGGGLTAEQRSLEGQSLWYTHVWEQDRQRLFLIYYEQLIAAGVSPAEALTNATQESARDANGGTYCDLNAPAAAWFWFTVQTTIGYGNQAPQSTAGRVLVYTIGFVSILAFGAILAMAGYILSFLYDDFAVQNKLDHLKHPGTASLIWGSVYYIWMALIAAVTIEWKERRLNLEFDMRDAYWFAYISTTTVGLGDFFFEPGGIIGADLVSLPLLFLVGLMMLAVFLGKFADLIVILARRDRKSLVDTLLEKRVRWRDTFAQNVTPKEAG